MRKNKFGETQRDILTTIEAYPGKTTTELMALLPHISKSSVQSTVSLLLRRGRLKLGEPRLGSRGGLKYSFRTYLINDGVPPPSKGIKLKNPTDAGLRAQLEQARQQIAELETWKQAAISRFPDLGVEPIVLKARKIVADEVRAGGDILLANQIVSGLKDSTLMVRVAIKALEEVA